MTRSRSSATITVTARRDEWLAALIDLRRTAAPYPEIETQRQAAIDAIVGALTPPLSAHKSMPRRPDTGQSHPASQQRPDSVGNRATLGK